jgi:hypothetical protein
MQATEKLRVNDCVAVRVRLAIPQPTEWQRIGDEMNNGRIIRHPAIKNLIANRILSDQTIIR